MGMALIKLGFSLCLESILCFEISVLYLSQHNIQSLTHPVVNVAIHLDNVHSLDSRLFPQDITACFCFKHT